MLCFWRGYINPIFLLTFLFPSSQCTLYNSPFISLKIEEGPKQCCWTTRATRAIERKSSCSNDGHHDHLSSLSYFAGMTLISLMFSQKHSNSVWVDFTSSHFWNLIPSVCRLVYVYKPPPLSFCVRSPFFPILYKTHMVHSIKKE